MLSLSNIIKPPTETLKQLESLRDLLDALNAGDIDSAKEWAVGAIKLLEKQLVDQAKSAG